jgi:hypothetical protein
MPIAVRVPLRWVVLITRCHRNFACPKNLSTTAITRWPQYSETGFDKKDWLRCYKAERKAGSLKAERSTRPAVSNSRLRIQWLVEAALPVKVLETNLYATPTRRASLLPVKNRDAWMFEFLLSEINPHTILLHGKEARKLFEQRFGCSPGEEFSVLNVLGRSVHIAAVPSLFDAPRQQTEQWGQQIRVVAGDQVIKICDL